MVMDVSGAVQWWEEWQLRILVLGSLVIQYILLASSVARKFPIGSWFRPVIWLAYLASDAIAIYALATLFNRQKKHDGHGVLELLWVPVLLIHLGGQDGITAYNIEDNEMWTRYILTAMSQITVAVYVFCKSWPGGDTNLLLAAILLFILGVLKCTEKPLALNSASINSLVSSGEPVRRSINTQKFKIDPLEDFIEKATSPVGVNDYLLTPATPADLTPYKLFVDIASPSADDRIRMLLSFSALDDIHAYCKLQQWLYESFNLLYTKQKMIPTLPSRDESGLSIKRFLSLSYYTQFIRAFPQPHGVVDTLGSVLRGSTIYLLVPAVALFHYSHREAYNKNEVQVTYALLCCTIVLEVCSFSTNLIRRRIEFPSPTLLKPLYDDKVSQYNLIGFLVRNRKHSKMMRVVGFLRCDDFLHQRWRMKSCASSFSISNLVLQYLKGGWEHHIRDVSSYRKFNDNRGQFTLQLLGCYQELGWSLEGAFDESVLLWHLATDLCYYDKRSSQHGSQCTQDSCPHVFACPAWCEGSGHNQRAIQCREMSNYMMYLLFVNPEMLMAGTRRNLFTAAYDELKGISIEGAELPVKETKLGQRINRKMPRARISFKENEQCRKERQLTQKIIVAVDSGGSQPDGSHHGIIHDAWSIARILSDLSEEEMWTVIEGVWVEMLCFSAARCRGYLHAKGQATGVEYLTYVWLLQYYMGMETLATKLQRVDHHHRNGGEHGGNPSSSRVSREATGQEQDAGPSRSSGGATDEEHAEGQSAGYHGIDASAEEIV